MGAAPRLAQGRDGHRRLLRLHPRREPADLEALEGFIDAPARAALPEHLWRADDLFVRAARIHAQLDAGARDIEALRADFRGTRTRCSR